MNEASPWLAYAVRFFSLSPFHAIRAGGASRRSGRDRDQARNFAESERLQIRRQGEGRRLDARFQRQADSQIQGGGDGDRQRQRTASSRRQPIRWRGTSFRATARASRRGPEGEQRFRTTSRSASTRTAICSCARTFRRARTSPRSRPWSSRSRPQPTSSTARSSRYCARIVLCHSGRCESSGPGNPETFACIYGFRVRTLRVRPGMTNVKSSSAGSSPWCRRRRWRELSRFPICRRPCCSRPCGSRAWRCAAAEEALHPESPDRRNNPAHSRSRCNRSRCSHSRIAIIAGVSQAAAAAMAMSIMGDKVAAGERADIARDRMAAARQRADIRPQHRPE